jgi:hypothetical protein
MSNSCSGSYDIVYVFVTASLPIVYLFVPILNWLIEAWTGTRFDIQFLFMITTLSYHWYVKIIKWGQRQHEDYFSSTQPMIKLPPSIRNTFIGSCFFLEWTMRVLLFVGKYFCLKWNFHDKHSSWFTFFETWSYIIGSFWVEMTYTCPLFTSQSVNLTVPSSWSYVGESSTLSGLGTFCNLRT